MKIVTRSLLALALLLPAFTPVMGQSMTRARAQSGERRMTRVLYFLMKDGQFAGIPGQFTIQYGSPQWKDSHQKQIDAFKGKQMRWRFGTDAWTTLDTNVPLDIGGQKVAPGIYYLVLEHTKENKMNLVVLDPKKVMANKYDAFQANATTGGTIIPLTHETGKKTVEDFTIKFVNDEKVTNKAVLHIMWGGHHLHAPVTATL